MHARGATEAVSPAPARRQGPSRYCNSNSYSRDDDEDMLLPHQPGAGWRGLAVGRPSHGGGVPGEAHPAGDTPRVLPCISRCVCCLLQTTWETS